MTTLGGSAAQVAAIPVGASVTSVGGQPVESWQRMQEILEDAPAGPTQIGLEGAAPVTLNLPPKGPSRDSVQASLRFLSDPVIGAVQPDMPAARAGIRADDRIVSIDGRPIRAWHEAVEVFRGSPGKPLRVELLRGGKKQTVTLTPDAEKEKVNGAEKAVGKIGALEKPAISYRRLGFGAAVATGFSETKRMITILLETLRDLLTGALSPKNLGGLLSIGEASGQSAAQGPASFLTFLAFLSVNLAVLNLLPIPILDGGHLMFLLVEAVRGRPLSVEARIRLSHVGLIIVVGLMLWANGNDVVRYLGRLLNR
jgi:regulator of sigma E protease